MTLFFDPVFDTSPLRSLSNLKRLHIYTLL